MHYRMKKLWLLLLLFPVVTAAHPGIGIVKDSKGNIYYTDLEQVWKIRHSNRTIAVPGVHTHELYMNRNDHLYGEHLSYAGEGSNKYYHYLWMLQPDGTLDTLLGPVQAYVGTNYSLARDREGNEYYIKQTDSSRIFKKVFAKKEVVFAEGNFGGVTWLHPQKNGSVLLIQKNTVYRIDSGGRQTIIAKSIAGQNPTFKFAASNRMAWGVWQDDAENVYVAVFSDQVIKKIDPQGTVTAIYKSAGNWTPLHGVFDNNNQLWILESSDKNEVRAVLANSFGQPIKQEKLFEFSPVAVSFTIVLAVILGYLFFCIKRRRK